MWGRRRNSLNVAFPVRTEPRARKRRTGRAQFVTKPSRPSVKLTALLLPPRTRKRKKVKNAKEVIVQRWEEKGMGRAQYFP
jgi:hypothetical protein